MTVAAPAGGASSQMFLLSSWLGCFEETNVRLCDDLRARDDKHGTRATLRSKNSKPETSRRTRVPLENQTFEKREGSVFPLSIETGYLPWMTAWIAPGGRKIN